MPRTDSRHPDLFRPGQPDLFAPPPAPREPEPDPIVELTETLARLRAAETHIWHPLSEAINQESRAYWLGQRSGPEGKRLASAIHDESERLFQADERRWSSRQ